jgi:hypothetical protein
MNKDFMPPALEIILIAFDEILVWFPNYMRKMDHSDYRAKVLLDQIELMQYGRLEGTPFKAVTGYYQFDRFLMLSKPYEKHLNKARIIKLTKYFTLLTQLNETFNKQKV